MVKGGKLNEYSFRQLIRKYLSSFFSKYEFDLIEYRVLDNGNIQTVIYQSPKYRICFYKSTRDGEINCLVGNGAADTKNLNSPEWFFLNSLIIDSSEVPIDELLKNVPDVATSEIDQMLMIAAGLEDNFNLIVNKLNSDEIT